MQVENISWKVGKRNRLDRSRMSFKVNTKSKPKKIKERVQVYRDSIENDGDRRSYASRA